jgi:glucose/arabinose dehydrogenase
VPSAAAAAKATAAAPFDPGQMRVQAERVGATFVQPDYVTHAGDGSGRIYVAEKIGRVRLLDGTVVLDISGRVASPPINSYDREQGFLGLAFSPHFAQNGYLYVHYNGRNGDHVVSRFVVGPNGRADPASEKVVLTQRQPGTNFNGGQLLFEGSYLYVGFGTGGAAVDLQANAVDLSTLLGKILRIDVDRGDPYAIPPDNPFVGRAGARPEVWAVGLRNPWRFSFDRSTRDLYVATPGQFQRDWITYLPGGTPGGRNFGWPVVEGSLCWNAPTCDRRGLEPPILEHGTYEGGSCAVIGGYVYRGIRIPGLTGVYVFGDFCSGRVWGGVRDAAGRWVRHDLLRLSGLISSFGEDEAGELYVTDISGGAVYRLIASPP